MADELSLDLLAEFTPGNPREIDDESLDALKASLEAFGDISGIVMSARFGLICGHQRVRALKATYGEDRLTLARNDSGALEVTTPDGEVFPVREVDWDEAKCTAANIAANSTLLAGTFTSDVGTLIAELGVKLPELSAALRLGEIEVPAVPVMPTAPGEFSELDENLETEFKCPSCGYEWSGGQT